MSRRLYHVFGSFALCAAAMSVPADAAVALASASSATSLDPVMMAAATRLPARAVVAADPQPAAVDYAAANVKARLAYRRASAARRDPRPTLLLVAALAAVGFSSARRPRRMATAV